MAKSKIISLENPEKAIAVSPEAGRPRQARR